MEFSSGIVEPEFARPELNHHPFSQEFVIESSSQFDNRNKCCRFCRRLITSEPTFHDTKDEAKFRTHFHIHNKQSNPFINANMNQVTPAIPESQRKHNIDNRWKDIGLLVAALNRLSAALVKQEDSHNELFEDSALHKEASDAIRRVESCLLGLQTGSNQHRVRDTITESIIQEELSDVVSGFSPYTVSANPLSLGSEFSSSENLLKHTIDRHRHIKKAIRQHSVASFPKDTRVPYATYNRLTHIMDDTASCFASGSYTSHPMENTSKKGRRGSTNREVSTENFKRSGVTIKLSRQSRVMKKYKDKLTSNSDDDGVGGGLKGLNGRKYRIKKMLLDKMHQVDDDLNYTNSSSTSYNERFYTPIHKQRQKYVTSSTTSSESIRYTPPRRSHRYQYEVVSSDTDVETSPYSRTSHEDHELTSTSLSYESEECSFPSSPRFEQETSSGGTEEYSFPSSHGETRIQKHHHKKHKNRFFSKNPKPDILNKNPKGAAWKKLKDKLAIIFHHHHHHHRHPTTSEDDNDKKEVGNTKVEKSIVNPARVSKYEHKHLGRLFGGLFSHIKHKKKSKTSAKKLGRSKHGGAKNMWKKKQHWWQMLHRKKHVKRLAIGHKNKMTL